VSLCSSQGTVRPTPAPKPSSLSTASASASASAEPTAPPPMPTMPDAVAEHKKVVKPTAIPTNLGFNIVPASAKTSEMDHTSFVYLLSVLPFLLSFLLFLLCLFFVLVYCCFLSFFLSFFFNYSLFLFGFRLLESLMIM
jgi:hypothetical protein